MCAHVEIVRCISASLRNRLWACLCLVCLLTAGLALMGACAFAPAPGAPGVTGGGQQDIASARKTIENGGIPDPDSITVEGFFSEHSIPIETPQDAGTLFAKMSAAWNQDFDAFTPLATIPIGFGTTIDMERFERPSLNLCVVIDRSGSMGDLIDVRSRTSKLDAVKIAIDRLLAHLDSDDRVSVVAFDSEPSTRLEPVPGNNIAAIKGAIDTIDSGGGTDLAAGMRRGYRVVTRNRSQSRSDRLIVFTDALLRYRQEEKVEAFIAIMKEYAGLDIGATMFGVGTAFGHDVAYDVSQVRGGNYFFLEDYDRIVSVFDEEFDFLVTPIAYDVLLDVSVPYEFDVVDVYGIPAEEPFPHEMQLEMPTLFFSSRQGGGVILIRVRAGAMVDFSEDNLVAEMSVSYVTADGEEITQRSLTATLPAGLDPTAAESYFESESTRRSVLLLNAALVLRGACEDAYRRYWYSSNRQQAIARLTEFIPYFDSLSEGLPDQTTPTSRTLSQERALLVRLLSNIESRG